MKKKYGIVTGFAVLLIAAIFIFAGCPTGGDEDDTGKGGGSITWTEVDKIENLISVYHIAYGGASGSEKFIAVGRGIISSTDGKT